jgi:hypothetical protein
MYCKRPLWLVLHFNKKSYSVSDSKSPSDRFLKVSYEKSEVIDPGNELFFLFQCNNSALHEQIKEGIISVYIEWLLHLERKNHSA